jgi:hypothetical protein
MHLHSTYCPIMTHQDWPFSSSLFLASLFHPMHRCTCDWHTAHLQDPEDFPPFQLVMHEYTTVHCNCLLKNSWNYLLWIPLSCLIFLLKPCNIQSSPLQFLFDTVFSPVLLLKIFIFPFPVKCTVNTLLWFTIPHWPVRNPGSFPPFPTCVPSFSHLT